MCCMFLIGQVTSWFFSVLHPWVLLFRNRALEVTQFVYSIRVPRYNGRWGACVPVTMPRKMYRCSRLEAKELRTRPAEDSRPPRITTALQERRFPSKPPRGAANTVCVDTYFTEEWLSSCLYTVFTHCKICFFYFFIFYFALYSNRSFIALLFRCTHTLYVVVLMSLWFVWCFVSFFTLMK